MRMAGAMIAVPLVSLTKGITTFGSSRRNEKFGPSKMCRSWLLYAPACREAETDPAKRMA